MCVCVCVSKLRGEHEQVSSRQRHVESRVEQIVIALICVNFPCRGEENDLRLEIFHSAVSRFPETSKGDDF